MTIKDPKIVNDFENNKYSEEQIRNFIKKYHEELDDTFWWYISHYQDLSEPFIREFKDKVDWWRISTYQNLSEPFIREFKDQVHWYCISQFQDLSEEFMIEYIKYIKEYEWINITLTMLGDDIFSDLKEGERFGGLISNKKVPEDVKERIINLKKVIDQ